ncbi:MAG: hypothetical protein KDH96_10555 [Candidatus Riesia sp.]|nr:hypothetical protein [Candidatus Riesia sp.]
MGSLKEMADEVVYQLTSFIMMGKSPSIEVRKKAAKDLDNSTETLYCEIDKIIESSNKLRDEINEVITSTGGDFHKGGCIAEKSKTTHDDYVAATSRLINHLDRLKGGLNRLKLPSSKEIKEYDFILSKVTTAADILKMNYEYCFDRTKKN